MTAINDTLSKLQSYMGSQAFDDLCQRFVEQVAYGQTGKYPSAIAAWNAQQGSGVRGTTNGIQPGDLLYFSDPNQPNGHTGIYTGNNQFTSATYNGVQNNDVNQWLKSTGQQLLGYLPQGHSAQTLGQTINQNTNSLYSNAQKQLDDMHSGRTVWDDNKISQLNGVLRGAQSNQAPQQDYASQMQNFSNAWNMTHQSPLAAYM